MGNHFLWHGKLLRPPTRGLALQRISTKLWSRRKVTSNKVIILSTDTFDPISEVDPDSVTFGETGDESSVSDCTKTKKDHNGDGRPDRVCHYNNEAAGNLQVGDTAILKGNTTAGTPIQGTDVVHSKKDKH